MTPHAGIADVPAAGGRVRAGSQDPARPGVPMGMPTRLLTALAALLLLAVFAFPLWRYDLGAPQYPEGLSMTIWANKIGGQLALVNQLNHYIGMRTIEPDAMAELRWIPGIVVALVVTGLGVAVVGRLGLLIAWFAAVAALGLAGLADFYWWLYTYGTQLNPEAPIQMPPFVPPLLGTKMLANFEVTTGPDVGGYAAFAAGLLALVAVVVELRRRRAS